MVAIDAGRWPPNVALGELAAAELDAECGVGTSVVFPVFRYEPKPSQAERNAGLAGLASEQVYGYKDYEPVVSPNFHATVKPVELMRWLVRLVTPLGGLVLDPFAGSGTTLVAAVLEGFDCVGIEQSDEYVPIIEGRVAWAHQQVNEAATATV